MLYKNISWVLSEKLITIFLGAGVSLLVARHLGPELFGEFSYATSLVAIITAASHGGLIGIVIKELVSSSSQSNEILGTSFVLKLVFSLSFLIVLLGYVKFNNLLVHPKIIMVLAVPILFIPFEVIEYLFIATHLDKYHSIAKIIAIVLGGLLKLSFICFSTSIFVLAIITIVPSIISTLVLIYFLYSKSTLHLLNWTFSKKKASFLIRRASLIFLGAICAVIYFKIDQLMLGSMSSSKELGSYAVAAKLSEVWYFLPVAIVGPLFPKLIKDREKSMGLYHKNLQKFFSLFACLGIVIAILVFVLAPITLTLFFGQDYSLSIPILQIHIWGGVFMFMRAVFDKWIFIENAHVFSLVTQGIGAISNIILNLLLIPKYHAIGAAYATLLSYFISAYLCLFLFRKTRGVFLMMTRSLFIWPKTLLYALTKIKFQKSFYE